MNTPALSCESDRLLSFCKSLVERRESWPPAEDTLAREFVSFCGITAFAHFNALTQLCVQLGIAVSVQPMPSELRGHNSFYNGTRTITIAERQSFPGAKEHTLLHELRELLEHAFVQLGFAVAASPADLETRAEHFASLVRASLAEKMMHDGWEWAEQVEKKWLRYGAYILTLLGVLAFFASCVLLPRFEDQALEFDRLHRQDK